MSHRLEIEVQREQMCLFILKPKTEKYIFRLNEKFCNMKNMSEEKNVQCEDKNTENTVADVKGSFDFLSVNALSLFDFE